MIGITSLGCVTGFGAGVDALSEGIRSDNSSLQSMYLDKYPFAQAPIAQDNRRDRCAMLLELAINEALDHAGIDRADVPLGLLVATTHGELSDWEQNDAASADFDWCAPKMPKVNPDATFGRTRQLPFTVTTACTASAHAVAYAVAKIKSGHADRFVVAGGDVISNFLMRGFIGLRALSKRGCTPFGATRDGISLGEGAAALVVESAASAEKRGARILAKIAGFGTATDAHHMTAPDPSGHAMARAIEMSLGEKAAVPDFVNAHGTGSDLNDAMEYNALSRCFGRQLSDISVSATKHTTGHICGGAAALELIICVETLLGQISPGILGTETFDKRFPKLKDSRTNITTHATPKTALSLNCAFGGNNTAILLESGQL